jgi:prophage regulatory protein
MSSYTEVDRLLRLPDVVDRVGLSVSWIYKNLADKSGFPAPVKIGARAVRWRESDLQAWEASLARREVL